MQEHHVADSQDNGRLQVHISEYSLIIALAGLILRNACVSVCVCECVSA